MQTVHYEWYSTSLINSRSSIISFINVNSKKFVGSEFRLHWFEFEDPIRVNANGIEIGSAVPVAVEYNQIYDEICIATKSDVRIMDIFTGKTKRILANVVDSNHEIT
jgi:hypothetical protein